MLFVYPVKSCRGMAVPQARLPSRGLQYDRERMVVSPNGRFLTQREEPRLRASQKLLRFMILA